MEILAPALAERFGLSYRPANSTQELLDCLQNGGQAIINVGGDRDGHTGVFSHHGHFILAVSAGRSEVCILDPSYKEHKYEEPGREGRSVLRDFSPIRRRLGSGAGHGQQKSGLLSLFAPLAEERQKCRGG